MLDNSRLRIAMQKSGRLSDESKKLLAQCGILFLDRFNLYLVEMIEYHLTTGLMIILDN